MTKTTGANAEGTYHVAMVIDDDELVRECVAAVLEDVCDQVYQAADGLDGLRLLEEHPDVVVVVTDIGMPRLDGIGFARHARRRRPDLKVLFMSGREVPAARETFLPKPFFARTLTEAVRRLLDE